MSPIWSRLCPSVRTDYDIGIDFAVVCAREVGRFPDFASSSTALQHFARELVRDP